MVTITCDRGCGLEHYLSDKFWKDNAARLRGPDIPVGNVYGCWYVPRLFLVFHPDHLAQRLRALADQYQWEEVRVRRPAKMTGKLAMMSAE